MAMTVDLAVTFIGFEFDVLNVYRKLHCNLERQDMSKSGAGISNAIVGLAEVIRRTHVGNNLTSNSVRTQSLLDDLPIPVLC